MEKEYFFDKPQNVKKFLKGFYISLVLLVVVDLALTLLHLKHPDFSWEKFPSFYGAFGFIACVLLVLAAKHILRKCVKRKEEYYD